MGWLQDALDKMFPTQASYSRSVAKAALVRAREARTKEWNEKGREYFEKVVATTSGHGHFHYCIDADWSDHFWPGEAAYAWLKKNGYRVTRGFSMDVHNRGYGMEWSWPVLRWD